MSSPTVVPSADEWMYETDRLYISRLSPGPLLIVTSDVYGQPAAPDGDVVVSMTPQFTHDPEVTLGGTWTATATSGTEYEVVLPPAATSTPGPFLARWDYTVGGHARAGEQPVMIGGSAPAYDALSPEWKAIVESVWLRVADQFDSPMGGPHLCVDEETQALTREGWKSESDLSEGDSVLTLNHETGLSEWQAVQRVNRYDVVDEKMVSMETKVHSSLTTPSHRWPVLSRNRKRQGALGRVEVEATREWRTSATLRGQDSLITAAPVADLPSEAVHSDALVELLAWVWTEGHFSTQDMLRISQSERVNPAHVARIRRALTALYGPPVSGHHPEPKWSEAQGSGGCVVWTLNTHAARALMPHFTDVRRKVLSWDWLRELTQSQLDMFIDVSILADGYQNQHTVAISQADVERLDAFDFACVLAGRTPRQRPIAGRGAWRTTLRPGNTVHVRNNPKPARYTGVVWCPTVANGTWLARRRGTVWFTGNSVYMQAHFGRNRIAQLLPIALGRMNTISQPVQTYSLADPFPFAKWGSLLSHALWVETIKHLRRSYMEQPDPVGVTVARLDRRTYMNLWGQLLTEEEAELRPMLDHFKMQHMNLGGGSVLVAGGIYPRISPYHSEMSGIAAPRGLYLTR